MASHPGSAKGVMINALKLASALINALPKEISPEHTEGRDGFIHPTDYKGTSEKAVLKFILRDFELDGLEAKRETLRQIVKNLQDQEPLAKWKITFHSQYRNMRYYLDKDPFVIEAAKKAVSKAGLVPFSEPVRGGTDGAHLTERGLPTPNIFTGFHNIHSEKEWICLQDMENSVKTLIHLAEIWEQEA
ncbi:MAG: M20/M25/M40 family metallo-hydrolase [Chlamydiae bacterium]|nr:M20/M25/M40 family metallo-hydrolase [Chlamydiota bacterium]